MSCAIWRVRPATGSLDILRRATGQTPAYFKRQTAPALRPCSCSSPRATAVSEWQRAASHTESCSPSWQRVRLSDKGDIKKKVCEGHPLRKVKISAQPYEKNKPSDPLSWSVSNQIHSKDTAHAEAKVSFSGKCITHTYSTDQWPKCWVALFWTEVHLSQIFLLMWFW